MASLTGASIASSYTSLLKLNGNTDTLVAGNNSNAIQVVDGDGTASPLYLNTDRLGIGGQPSVKLQIEESTNGADIQFNMRALNDGGAGRTTAIKYDPDARKMHFGEDFTNLVLDTSNVRVGIGTDSPDGKMHIFSNSAGSMTPNSEADNLIIEDSATPGMSILFPNNSKGTIAFGHPSDDDAYTIIADANNGRMTFSAKHASDVMRFSVAGANRAILDANSRISLSNNDSGTSNTVFGSIAGDDLASGGNFNSFFGHNTGHAVTTGDYNTAIGLNALDGATVPDRVTAIGTASMRGAVTADAIGSVGVGYASLNNLASGSGNVAIGYQSGLYLTTGGSNTLMGYEAGLGASGQNHSETTAIGYRAGYSLTTGASNTFVGRQSGLTLTTGHNNVGVGNNALAVSTDVGYAVAVGNNAMSGANVTAAADGSVAVGGDALKALTTGERNTAIGYGSLDAEDAGSNNTAVGYEALTAQNNDTGANTAVGMRAGLAVSTGYSNTLLGSGSGASLQGGYQNTYVGRDADGANDRINSTAVGFGTTAQANNSVTLGNASVDAVYMAQDKGAKIYAGNAQFAAPDNSGHLIVDLWADRGDENADKWRIEIEDSADFTIESFTSGSWVEKLAIANDGTFTGSSSNDISDERLKENIKNITGGLDAINKLQGRTFNWKKSADMNTRTNYGLIAQEVEKVIPELIYEKGGIRELTPEVLYSEKDTIPSNKKIGDVKEKATYYKSLNTSGLVPVLIEAVKELSAKVTELENKLK